MRGSHQPAYRKHGGSPKGDVVVKNGKHSGMPALLVRDEATGGLHGKTIPISNGTQS
jgi:hypothetical protein